MKKLNKVGISLLLIAALVLSTYVCACAEEKTTITILRPGDETKVRNFIEPAIAQFEEENPDIDVEIIYNSWGGWISTYPSQFQAGTQPDVIYWWDKAMLDTYANGKILPIEEYVDSSVWDDIPESIIEMVKIDGVLYHVPVDMYGQVMYYRKDIFEQAGLDPDNPPTTCWSAASRLRKIRMCTRWRRPEKPAWRAAMSSLPSSSPRAPANRCWMRTTRLPLITKRVWKR
jgi:ABC-type glycerol-3-phosphate transport system substrate-binding protein